MRKTMGVWRERITLVATDTTATLYSDKVPEDERWYLQRVSVRDDTTGNADCLVCIDAGTHVHPLYYFGNITKDVEKSDSIECWLRAGERLQFDWTDIVAGDKLFVHVTGHKQGTEQK